MVGLFLWFVCFSFVCVLLLCVLGVRFVLLVVVARIFQGGLGFSCFVVIWVA